ncbi:MAG: large subunit ribosomal protein [Thermoleophilales bacterium]|nr:large subunit ribosomal protein [Thermoleophilales bacterium]
MAGTETKQEVRAEAKWVRISPRKARLVAEHIRGRSVPEARTVLAFTQRAAARELEKVLKSAVSNAEANHGLIGDDLLVSAAYIDEGPTIKRWRARARGRVARIHKRTCHITVKLAENPAVAARPKRAAKAQAAPAPVAAEKPKTPRKTRAEKPEVSGEAKPKRARAPRRKKTEETES